MAVQLASVQETITLNLSYLRLKRIMDILFTLLMLPLLIILTLVIAALIRLDSPGPVFFRQKRVGLNGVEFDMLKFRSMYVDCDDSIHRDAIGKYMSGQKLNDTPDSSLTYKQVDDPRITKVGRFLRKTSIDELPQFLNVLRGRPEAHLPHHSGYDTGARWSIGMYPGR